MTSRARLIGFNHIAVEVGDVEEALDFMDPWGKRWQVVEYGGVQFTKAPEVLEGMGAGVLRKTEKALDERRRKGMAPTANVE